MTALDMPARLGDLLDDATEHIVVTEESRFCEWRVDAGPECGRPAAWDLLVACVLGCESASQWTP